MESLFLTLVNMSITATWVVLAFTILRPLLKKVPKWVNCFLWGVVGLRLCVPFSFESVFSLIPTTQTIPSDITMSKNPQIDTGVGIVNEVVNPVISESFTPDPSYSANPLQVIVGVASYIWVVGLVLMVIYCVVSYILLKRKVSASVHYNNNIYYCDNIETPFILGVIKPKIYIPSGVNESDLVFIIGHEKSHLKRKDYLIKPFSFLLLSVYWFNPAIWLWYILLCRDIESACDEKAIKFYDDEYKKLYSTALLNCSTQKRIIMACPVAFGETGVKQRIKSVLNYKKPAFWVVGVAIVLTTFLTIFFATNPQNSDFKNVIDEKGYEIISVELTSISMDTVADNILTRSPESERKFIPRFKIHETEKMSVFLEKVDLSDDEKDFYLTFSIEYNALDDWGVIYSPYYKNENGYSYFLNLGDKVSFYSLTGDTGECLGEVISLGPDTEFVVKVEKDWLKQSEDSKIDIEFKIGEITYKKKDMKIEDELSVFLDTQLAGIFDSQQNDKNFNAINYKILDEEKKGEDTTLYMTVMWQEYYYSEETGLSLKREYHYPVSLTYQNSTKLFSKNGKSYNLVKCWVPENNEYDDTELFNNFSNDSYNEFKENKTNFYTYQKNCCETSAKENFNVNGLGIYNNEPTLDIKDRFNFNNEYNVFNPENTVAIKVSSTQGNNEYQKVITDPKVFEKLYDIIFNEIYSTKAVKVTRETAGDLNGLTIVLEDYMIYNSEPLSYCFDKHYLISPYFLTPDGCYKLERKQLEEIEKLILEATDDTTADLTPLINSSDIIEHYDMGDYNVSLSSDWYYNSDSKTFINENNNQTLKVERKFYAFSDYYDMLKDDYNNALKTLGKENVSWNEDNLGFTDEIGVSNECIYIKKEPDGATAKIFFIYSKNVFVITIFDANGDLNFDSFKELAYKVDFIGKTISGGSARANGKTETTTRNVKIVTSDKPPENTTSPEGYTTPYIDYFTPEGEHVYEYYVTE